MTQTENRINNIANLLRNADKNLRKAQKLLESLSQDVLESYDDIPGTLGIFDGVSMVTPEGKSYEVNPNYAAKSMLVVGDNLKMVEEGEKQVFKQISKVPRKRVEGILNKKEGNWYALTDTGSYQLLDVAVEFRDGEVNDELVVLIPEENLDAAYATLEKLMRDGEEKKPGKKDKVESKEEKKSEDKPEKKETIEDKSAEKETKKKPAPKKTEAKKVDEDKSEDKPTKKSNLEEDDLV